MERVVSRTRQVVHLVGDINDTLATKTPKSTSGSFNSHAVKIDGIVYVPGEINGGDLATLEAYDPSADTWSFKTSKSTARSCLTSGTVNNRIYAIRTILARGSTFSKSVSPVTIVTLYSKEEVRTKQSVYKIGYAALYSEDSIPFVKLFLKS